MLVPVKSKTASNRFCDGSRRDNGDALPHVLPVEGARDVRRRDFAFALVRHLDVTPKRNRRQRPFGLVAAEAARRDDAAKPDRKAKYLDAAQPCDDVVAELVKHDEHAERHEEANDLVGHLDHAATVP
jgi:hypothetical protein